MVMASMWTGYEWHRRTKPVFLGVSLVIVCHPVERGDTPILEKYNGRFSLA